MESFISGFRITKIRFMNKDDEILIEKAKEGDINSLEILLKKYNGYIKAIARSVCVSAPSEVDDVHSETMISIMKNIKNFKGKANFSTWFYRIVQNHCLMRYRKINRENKLFLEDLKTLNNKNEDSKLYFDFFKSLSKLPIIYRSPIILVDIEGLSLKEAAEKLGISIGALKSRLFRGRRYFKKILEEFEK